MDATKHEDGTARACNVCHVNIIICTCRGNRYINTHRHAHRGEYRSRGSQRCIQRNSFTINTHVISLLTLHTHVYERKKHQRALPHTRVMPTHLFLSEGENGRLNTGRKKVCVMKWLPDEANRPADLSDSITWSIPLSSSPPVASFSFSLSLFYVSCIKSSDNNTLYKLFI